MSTFPQSADDYTMFAQLVRRQQADWSLPQNNPRQWYVEDAGVFDLVTPLEGYRTADDFVAGANHGFFNKAARADFTLKQMIRVTRISDDVVLTEVLLHGSAQLKTSGDSLDLLHE